MVPVKSGDKYTIALHQDVYKRQPWDSVVLERFKNKAGSKGRCVTLHHLEMKAADRLHLPEREDVYKRQVPARWR